MVSSGRGSANTEQHIVDNVMNERHIYAHHTVLSAYSYTKPTLHHLLRQHQLAVLFTRFLHLSFSPNLPTESDSSQRTLRISLVPHPGESFENRDCGSSRRRKQIISLSVLEHRTILWWTPEPIWLSVVQQGAWYFLLDTLWPSAGTTETRWQWLCCKQDHTCYNDLKYLKLSCQGAELIFSLGNHIPCHQNLLDVTIPKPRL